MNSVHDMGGMDGLGAIERETDEPVFHADWEAKVFALTRAMSAWRKWNIDASRHQRELIPGAEYMRMSYYEKWLAGLESLIDKSGLMAVSHATPALKAEQVAELVERGASTRREVALAPRFAAGEPVRARNINPAGHTRLPRYTRGKLGVIDRDHGVFVFPDTNAHFLGECPQHVYSVRFAARELWGEQASPRDAVFVDLWEDYLEPV
jgi:nitrile hydratase beta subunit